MNRLYIMVGLPGSGKSSYADVIANYSGVIILSSDTLRVEMYGYEDQTHNAEVFAELNRRTKYYAKLGADVIYDATNLSRKRRVALATEMKKHFSSICVIMCVCGIEEIIERNATRTERHLEEDKLHKMIKTMEVPTKYEYPYETIEYVYTGTTEYLEIDKLDYLMSYDQHNKHHSEELGKHIKRVTDACHTNPWAYIAGMYHDLGKPFCKTVDEEGYYHFIGHPFVSAYMYLCDILVMKKDFTEDFHQRVVQLVLMHDWIFNFKHDIDKMRKHYDNKYNDLDDTFWDAMEVLIKADRLRPSEEV